jgi:hypothetical protein
MRSGSAFLALCAGALSGVRKRRKEGRKEVGEIAWRTSCGSIELPLLLCFSTPASPKPPNPTQHRSQCPNSLRTDQQCPPPPHGPPKNRVWTTTSPRRPSLRRLQPTLPPKRQLPKQSTTSNPRAPRTTRVLSPSSSASSTNSAAISRASAMRSIWRLAGLWWIMGILGR